MYALGSYPVQTSSKFINSFNKHGNIVSLHDITSGVTNTGSSFKRSLLVTDQGVLVYTDTEIECDGACLAYFSVDASLKHQIPAGKSVIGSKLVLANTVEEG